MKNIIILSSLGVVALTVSVGWLSYMYGRSKTDAWIVEQLAEARKALAAKKVQQWDTP